MAATAHDKLKLWFFRDMNDEQRLKLFSLFELPTDEIGKTHGRQSIALKSVVAALSRPEGDATGRGTVCSHGIRWPWACHDCDQAALAIKVK